MCILFLSGYGSYRKMRDRLTSVNHMKFAVQIIKGMNHLEEKKEN